MAEITLDEFRRLVDTHVDWRSEGWSSPHDTLSINLSKTDEPTRADETFDADLAGKHLTYEGRSVTVVLDFDAAGYLTLIELV